MKEEIRRIARLLTTSLRHLGYRVSLVSHSPKSMSIYYKVWHPSDPKVRESEIRISDHEIYTDARRIDIILSGDKDKNEAQLMEWLEAFADEPFI